MKMTTLTQLFLRCRDNLNSKLCASTILKYFVRIGLMTISPHSTLSKPIRHNIYKKGPPGKSFRLALIYRHFPGRVLLVRGDSVTNLYDTTPLFLPSDWNFSSVLECWRIYSLFEIHSIYECFRLRSCVYESGANMSCSSDFDHRIFGTRIDHAERYLVLSWFDRIDRMLFWKLILRLHHHCSTLCVFINEYL
jgi:hypothetical protein